MSIETQDTQDTTGQTAVLNITPSLHKRVARERTSRGIEDGKLYLSVRVDGGGCSGFQYIFDWIAGPEEDDDIVFEDAVVTDPMSLEFLAGSTINFVADMMGEHFAIENPNASSGCGCGASFSA